MFSGRYLRFLFDSLSQIKDQYGPNLDSLQTGHTVGITVNDDSTLHLYVNGIDQGSAAKDIPPTCYAVVDLYGQCEQVSTVQSLLPVMGIPYLP